MTSELKEQTSHSKLCRFCILIHLVILVKFFPKLYFCKLYFLKCIVQNCIFQTVFLQTVFILTVFFQTFFKQYFAKLYFSKLYFPQIFPKSIFNLKVDSDVDLFLGRRNNCAKIFHIPPKLLHYLESRRSSRLFVNSFLISSQFAFLLTNPISSQFVIEARESFWIGVLGEGGMNRRS